MKGPKPAGAHQMMLKGFEPRVVTGHPSSNLAAFVHPERVVDPSKPHVIFQANPVAGKQALVTPTVKEFAKQFKAPRNISSVQHIVDAVRDQIKWKTASLDEAQHLYSQRTATDIIHSRKALVLAPAERARLYDIRGCVDYGLALVATLRAKKVPADFARRGQRTLVFFKFHGKEYYVDPRRHPKDPEIREISEMESRIFQQKAAQRGFSRGADAWGINIKGPDDYNRYVGPLDSLFMEPGSRLSPHKGKK